MSRGVDEGGDTHSAAIAPAPLVHSPICFGVRVVFSVVRRVGTAIRDDDEVSRGVDEGGVRGAVRGVDVRVSPGPFRLLRESAGNSTGIRARRRVEDVYDNTYTTHDAE